MRYVEFRDVIHEELIENPEGFTWTELKERLGLPYDQPCPEWVNRMEQEIGLTRARGARRAYLWKIKSNNKRLSFGTAVFLQKALGAKPDATFLILPTYIVYKLTAIQGD